MLLALSQYGVRTSCSMLPARVRISHPPLPLAATLAKQLERLGPQATLSDLEQAALAIAGGKVIGAALVWPHSEAGQPQIVLAVGWRGRGIEQALAQAVA